MTEDDDEEDDGKGQEPWIEEMRRLRRAMLARIGRLEGQVQDIADMCKEEAEAQHELAVQVNGFQNDLGGLRSEVVRAVKAVGGKAPPSPSPSLTPPQAPSTMSPECRELELRSIRAELELKAVRAELELKAIRAEMELRALRAEQELQIARDEFEEEQRRLRPDRTRELEYECRNRPACGEPMTIRHMQQFGPPDLEHLRWLEQFSEDINGICDYGWDDSSMDGYPGFPGMPFVDPVLILDRYEVYPLDILGQGGFSVVRRGMDIDSSSGEIFAVKSYTEMESMDESHPQYNEARDYFIEKFRHEVEIFEYLHQEHDMKSLLLNQKARQKQGSARDKRMSWYIPDAIVEDSKLIKAFEGFPSASELFVRLLDYSKECRYASSRDEGDKDLNWLKQERDNSPGFLTRQQQEWIPGPADDGICYIVLELADYTLHEFLQYRLQVGPPLSLSEVAQIFRQLAQIIAGLHARNFVHADLKPLNVMHFPTGRWKLIDMDGMVTPGITEADSICYTPLYCAPELAGQCLEGRDQLDISRHLDVWSLGMSVCELVTLTPVLEPKLQEINDVNDFLSWLARPEIEIEVPPEVYSLDPLLGDVLQRMITKDTSIRASMVEVLIHPFFTGEEGVEATLEKGNRRAENLNARRYCRHLLYRAVSTKVLMFEQRETQQNALGKRRSVATPSTGPRRSMLQMAAPALAAPTSNGKHGNKEHAVPLTQAAGTLVRRSMAYPSGMLLPLQEKPAAKTGVVTRQGDDERGAAQANGGGAETAARRRLSSAAGTTCMKRDKNNKLPSRKRLSAIREYEDEEHHQRRLSASHEEFSDEEERW